LVEKNKVMVKEQDLFGIQRTCYSKNSKSGEQFIKEHGLAFIVSGEMEAYDGHTKHLYGKGDIVLYRKNALIRFVKYPAQEEPFEAISIILDESLLQNLAQQNQFFSTHAPKESLFKLKEDILLTSYFVTLENWFAHKISPALIDLKKREAVHLLLRNNKAFKDVLFHFGSPGKINLEAFMNTHFRFNVPLTQLAFLTGRSLATFKRDFEKIFQVSPSKWLQFAPKVHPRHDWPIHILPHVRAVQLLLLNRMPPVSPPRVAYGYTSSFCRTVHFPKWPNQKAHISGRFGQNVYHNHYPLPSIFCA